MARLSDLSNKNNVGQGAQQAVQKRAAVPGLRRHHPEVVLDFVRKVMCWNQTYRLTVMDMQVQISLRIS